MRAIHTRGGVPPPDDAVVIRGGSTTLSDVVATERATENQEPSGFFGISVFIVPGSTP